MVQSNATSIDFERLFALDVNPQSIAEDLVQIDPQIAPYVLARPGLRVLRQPDVTETIFGFICSANNHVPRIRSMVGYLADLGETIPGTDKFAFRAFPRVTSIATLDPMTLRIAGFGYRAEKVVGAAQVLASNKGWERSLRKLDYEGAIRFLTTLPGVGPKVADCIALFALGHGQAVPIDTHVWTVVTQVYFPEWADQKVTPTTYRKAAEFLRNRFGERAGWLQQCLFCDSFHRP